MKRRKFLKRKGKREKRIPKRFLLMSLIYNYLARRTRTNPRGTSSKRRSGTTRRGQTPKRKSRMGCPKQRGTTIPDL
jgi:hypothetical protein